MIYFLPNDRPFRQEVVDAIKVRIREIQSFYSEQMEAHGLGRRTVHIETDGQGPLVHRVDGQLQTCSYVETGAGWPANGDVKFKYRVVRNP